MGQRRTNIGKWIFMALALALVVVVYVLRGQPVAPQQRHRSLVTVRSWSAQLFTSGGYSGGGRGFLFMGSDGTTSPCSVQKLPPNKRLAIEGAVAAARPETWKESYRPRKEHMTDQFYYSFTLKLQRIDGSSGTYSVGWQSESKLPDDLRRLYEALWAARDDCPGRRPTSAPA
jgi:hypothetical protein